MSYYVQWLYREYISEVKILFISTFPYSILKSRGTRHQIANIHWIIQKNKNSRKTFTSVYWLWKAFDCVDHNKLWKFFERWEYQTTWPVSWEICMQVKKQQLELDMEKQTGSK